MATEPGKNVEFAGLNKLLEVYNNSGQYLKEYKNTKNGFLELQFKPLKPFDKKKDPTFHKMTNGTTVLVQFFNQVMGGTAQLEKINDGGGDLVLEGETVEVMNLQDALTEATTTFQSITRDLGQKSHEDWNGLIKKWMSLLSALEFYGVSRGDSDVLSLVKTIRNESNTKSFQKLKGKIPSFGGKTDVFMKAINELENKIEGAAVKIQAVFKGYMARQRVKKLTASKLAAKNTTATPTEEEAAQEPANEKAAARKKAETAEAVSKAAKEAAAVANEAAAKEAEAVAKAAKEAAAVANEAAAKEAEAAKAAEAAEAAKAAKEAAAVANEAAAKEAEAAKAATAAVAAKAAKEAAEAAKAAKEAAEAANEAAGKKAAKAAAAKKAAEAAAKEAERKRQEAEAATRLENLLSGEFQQRTEHQANILRQKAKNIIKHLRDSKLDTTQQVIDAKTVSEDIVEYLETVGKVRVYLVQGGKKTNKKQMKKLEIFKENEIVEIDVKSPLRNPNPKKIIQFGPFTKVMPWDSVINATIDTIVQDIKPVADHNNVTILAFGISGSGKTTYMKELKNKLCSTNKPGETSYFGLKKQDLSNINGFQITNSGNNSRRVNKEWFSKAIKTSNEIDVDIVRSSPLNEYSSRVFSKETCLLDNRTYTFIDLPGLEDISTILEKYEYRNSFTIFVNNPTEEIQKFTKQQDENVNPNDIIKLFLESIFISYALDLLKFFLIQPERIKMEKAQLIKQLINSQLLLESENKQNSALFSAILSFRDFLFSPTHSVQNAADASPKERYVLLCHLPYAHEAKYGPYNKQIIQSLAFANAISSTAAKLSGRNFAN